MKKYVKPELFYEHYELSQHIADCAWEMTSGNESSCYAQPDPAKLPGHENLFMSTTSGCAFNETNYNAYCYHGGVNSVNTFAS